MHAIVKICMLLLLTVATKADQTAMKALAPQFYNQLTSVPPDNWAQRDWVPEKNRRFNARNIPIGQGELETEHAYRRMPKRFHIRRHRMGPRLMRANNHLDLLKRHILNDYKRISNRKLMNKKGVRKAKQLHHNKRKVAGKHTRKSKNVAGKHTRKSKNVAGRHTRKSKKVEKLFPKDFRITEEFKFKFPNNDICANSKLKPHEHYFLLPWWYYYCYKYQDRETKNNYHGPVYMPLYRQAVDQLKRYKKMKEARVRDKENKLGDNRIVV